MQINNAGFNHNVGSENSVELAEKVISINYTGTKNMVKAAIPLMKPNAAGARIVTVSSRLGRLNGRKNVSIILGLSQISLPILDNFSFK